MALLVDKGFHQQRAVAVAAPEVVRQTAQGEREGLGGEILAVHAGTDQEAAQADHAMQLAGAGVGIPADEGVARGQGEGGGGEADGPQHAVLGDQQVAQLGAGVLDRPARVLAGDQRVPQLQLAAVADLDQSEFPHLIDPFGHVPGRLDRAAETARATAAMAVPGSRQLDLAAPLELAQSLHAAGDLQPVPGIPEPEQRTDSPANLGAAGRGCCRHQCSDLGKSLVLGKRRRNPVLLIHA